MTEQEQNFDHAIALAAAFVANGDIRLHEGARFDQDAMHMLKDLIGVLYTVVSDARDLAARDG